MKRERDSENLTVRFLPFEASVEVAAGTILLDAARMAGLPISAPCGGKGTCGDCVVQILDGTFRVKSSAALPKHLARQGYTLACQTEITGDLTVDLPHFEEINIKSTASFVLPEDGCEVISGTCSVSPIVREFELRLPSPSLEDSYGDLTRLGRELKRRSSIKGFDIEYSVLKDLAETIRRHDGCVSAVLFGGDAASALIDLRPPDRAGRLFGIACDIGTTTVASSLVSLTDGRVLETGLGLNRQLKCGEDIISRIDYARTPARLRELRDLAVATVNGLTKKITDACGIAVSDIYYGAFSGNTTMMHLLLGLDPRHIREEPYVPTFNRLPFMRAVDLGLAMNREARIYCAPAVGSYVGGDITAGILATPMLVDSDRVSMFIDAGTNGELVIGNKDWLMTCACSAGPAFEGGGVRCGMPATEGGIERVRIDEGGEVHYEVIGDIRPRGICGSGLVDLVAELLSRDCLDRQGRFRSDRFPERLTDSEEGIGFVVEGAPKCYWGRDIVITERDVANLIRTKGAVFSACSLLLKQVGLTFDQVDAFYVAGGFGQHLDIENAVRIGLLPDIERTRFHYLGNTSLFGAYLALISEANRESVDAFSKRMTYVELNTDPGYMNEYTGALFLPHTDLSLFPSVREQ
jgi:uncharacterized 2Fe-2S/4Fe-4S cluster protein (DUF4445 family)